MQVAAEREGVCLVGCDLDRDGGKFFLVAGAPTASEWDEERMLRVVRRVCDASLPLPVRAGVNRGRVFTGEVGTDVRRTWAVMGDAVNVAARLMARTSPGYVTASPAVVERALSLFETRRLEPLLLKGKSEPVEALSLGRMLGPKRHAGDSSVPLTGRAAEKALMQAAIDDAIIGRGHVMEMVGEAGLGKSRLLEELHTMASGIGVQAIACNPYGNSRPMPRSAT